MRAKKSLNVKSKCIFYLSGCFFCLNAEKPVTVFRRTINVPEGTAVLDILSDETDFVHWVVIQAILKKSYSNIS